MQTTQKILMNHTEDVWSEKTTISVLQMRNWGTEKIKDLARPFGLIFNYHLSCTKLASLKKQAV